MAMNKTLKNLLILAALIIAGLVIYTIVKPGWFMDLGMKLTAGAKHRNAATEQAAFTLSAADLSAAFKTNVTDANAKYIDKAILVNGNVTAIEENRVTMENVVCTIDSADVSAISKLAVGQPAKIQGRLTTYNDLMEEIQMDQCVIK